MQQAGVNIVLAFDREGDGHIVELSVINISYRHDDTALSTACQHMWQKRIHVCFAYLR